MLPGQGNPAPPAPGGPPMGDDVISKNRSVMNPVDMAAMVTNGTVQPGMTVKDLIEKVFKVPIDAPVEQLVEAIKRQGLNQSGVGKMQAMAGGAPGTPPGQASMPQRGPAPMPNRMPMGQPQAAPAGPAGAGRGIADLMGR